DTECELDKRNFENFCESLRTGVENALDGFVKWMEVWVHLPLNICRLGGENRPEFAYAFLNIFFNKNSSKNPTLQEISYVQILKEDLSNGRPNTFGLLEA
ncbi:21793_t:CDS:1, partial [Racocetra persica]